MQLNWGGSISFGGKTEYILVHGPGIKHGANENLSFLYHILRADMFNPRTTAADHLDLEIDGASDNVTTAAQMFYCHLCKVGWKCTVCTNRMCRHHTQNIQDQRHYVTRYFGWNKCFTTTNLAQGLYQMLLGYRNSAQRVVILLLEKNYDWETYFSPCVNPNIKYAGKPLHWKYVQSPVEGGMPTAEYKQSGDVNAHWCGEGGVPGVPQLAVYKQEPILSRPSQLPPVYWLTEKQRKDLDDVFGSGMMIEEEISWMKEIMFTGEITRIHRDGQYGEGNLPGYPGHVRCKDKKGNEWRADIHVLGDLPDDLWATPPNRVAIQEARVTLIPEEEATLAKHRIFSQQETPSHPATYPGARVLTEDEKKLGAASKLRKITVKKLKEFCAHHGLAQNGLRPALVARVWQYWTTERQQEKVMLLKRLLKQVRLCRVLLTVTTQVPEAYIDREAYDAWASEMPNEIVQDVSHEQLDTDLYDQLEDYEISDVLIGNEELDVSGSDRD
eukprot:g24493.t1